MQVIPRSHGDPKTLTWGLFLALAAMAIAIAAGFSSTPVLLLVVAIAVIWAFRYIYVALYVGILMTPFLGVIVSVPTGDLALGQRAFGGSIDVSLGEVIFFCILSAWALKMLFLWWRRRDQNWRPRWPLLFAYLPLVLAHLASAFSPLEPDPYVVVKFALRPVFFDYLAYIALPVNLIKSRRRLVAALGAFAAIGVFAAVNGLLSMFFPAGGGFLTRAHPLDIFGVPALGENFNELAELLASTAPATLALSHLVKSPRAKRLLAGAAFFQLVMGLLTFTRTIWIVFAVEAAFMAWSAWRVHLRRHLARLFIGALVLLPFGIGMVIYSLSATAQSSNSTRLMLSQIAQEVFQSSPIFGGGAGTFLNLVGSTRVFLIEYGAPLDSHGFIQKIAAETGTLGLVALLILIFGAARFVWLGLRKIHLPLEREVILLLTSGAGGVFIYELFNTSYWTGKMWLPLGLLLSALTVLGNPPLEPSAPTHAILEE